MVTTGLARRWCTRALIAACAPVACAKPVEMGASGEATAGSATGASDDAPVTDDGMEGPTPSGGADEGPAPTTAATGDSGVPFIQDPDGGAIALECDVWAQDCPPGEKCMPWAADGGNSWNATRCSPVDAGPDQVGDACSVEGSGVSGIDSCDVASMCYYVDADTNLGTCVAFCGGSMAAPTCDAGFVCAIANDGVLILCRPQCDPLLQDCSGNAVCLPAAGSQLFTCVVDASGESGAAGDACEFLNACDAGLFCNAANAVPNCRGVNGCCSEFCDLNDGDPDGFCSLGGGQECIPWYEMGQAPPEYGHVGACSLPA